MNSTSPLIHGRGANVLGGVLWREALLLAGASILVAGAVAFGLGAAFGPCPQRQVAPLVVPALHPTSR